MKMIAALMFMILAHSATNAPLLWRDLPAGATLQEVREKIPGATTPNDPSILGNGEIKGLLEVAGFQLVDVDFKATLFFRDQRLDRIFLKPTEQLSGQKARVAARRLRESLQAKYGAPIPADKSRSSKEAEWSRDGSLIKFSFTQYSAEGVGFLQVTYLSPQDTSNL